MKSDDTRTCLVCGAQFPAVKGFCPVCILREALDEPVKLAKSSFNTAVVSRRGKRPSHRFDNYKLLTGKDGKPVELGRGGMGVTYKGFDVDLRCPVTLKVISEQYLGDNQAQLRFLREARAAAKVRHSNVASVLHLGRTGKRYFYAMEFVEGETLENLIKRSGRLEPKLVLEIATQVTAGLAAVHTQKLVHRDIKPSNIMVSLEETGAVTVKIIDLGLAKTVSERGPETAISTLGAFAGTPEFASPEQFAGVPVDIRSDLYSLGVTLWEMVTGKRPFRGTPADVMFQHQNTPLPFGELKGVPQPIVVLLEVLLEKDPARRFQTPAELLRGISAITGTLDARRRITRQELRQIPPSTSRGGTWKPPARLGPKKISIARLPLTGSDLFGRDEDIDLLDRAWANQDVNVVTIVAWAGVGKSTLVNHWLRRMAADHYRSAELVFGWSFYRQGTTAETSSADEFIDAALSWFGDRDPRVGTAWEKGERLAKHVADRRTLLFLDGLEPLQNPPGRQEGRLREPALQALLRELAGFNKGLCVITTRIPVADIADHEQTSAPRRDLDQLSSEDGAKLLRARGVKGDAKELRIASDEFRGHCLALTLLGSYLTDAFSGDIRFRDEISKRLACDVRQGVHAKRVMESYQKWFGEGSELAVLRILGLFDRPADEKAIATLLEPPAIPGLTESLTDLSQIERRTIIARLRRARLLAAEDPNNPGQLDTHPLVREYFGEQLRNQRTEAWKESNRRLYHYYRVLAPELPETLREMEPLFLAVICGCNAGLYREALHEVYITRIQRGDTSFAAEVLGARGALLAALSHFFEQGRWGSLGKMIIDGEKLPPDDQLYVFMQAGLNLAATRDFSAQAQICQHMETLCRSLNRPRLLYLSLIGQAYSSLATGTVSATIEIAKRAYSLAKKEGDPALMMGANRVLAVPLYYSGNFENARDYAIRGVQIWRSGVQSSVEEADPPAVDCLAIMALCEWHFGETDRSKSTMAEAISLARELGNLSALAFATLSAGILARLQNNPSEAEYLASHLIEVSTRRRLAMWLPLGNIHLGWARAVSGDVPGGLLRIAETIQDSKRRGSVVTLPYFLTLKAEVLHLADRTSEALVAINEAGAVSDRSGVRCWSSELHRLRGVFWAAMGADENQVNDSFVSAIGIAREQKSISLEKRAQAACAEYLCQKANSSGSSGVRLSVW